MSITDKELIDKARKQAKYQKLKFDVKIGDVGCALITDKNNVYQGTSIDARCGVGFCAESSAIAAMVTKGEFKIKKIVAVACDGTIVPPCGRCREIIYEMDESNWNAQVIIGENKIVKLKELLPNPWQKLYLNKD
ncbi:MAG: cytidine deaminase [archaeon]